MKGGNTLNTYLITYDLHTPGQKYDCIKNKIENNYGWWKCLNNIYIIKTNQTAVQIRDFLKNCIDNNDTILVTRLNGEAAWQGFDTQCSNWLKVNL